MHVYHIKNGPCEDRVKAINTEVPVKCTLTTIMTGFLEAFQYK